jgi:hypothetical protein
MFWLFSLLVLLCAQDGYEMVRVWRQEAGRKDFDVDRDLLPVVVVAKTDCGPSMIVAGRCMQPSLMM